MCVVFKYQQNELVPVGLHWLRQMFHALKFPNFLSSNLTQIVGHIFGFPI